MGTDDGRQAQLVRDPQVSAASSRGQDCKGASLAGMLYMPESFNAEKKNEITQRRLAQMMRIATPEKGTRRLMLVVGR
jgi:hypothetical protein